MIRFGILAMALAFAGCAQQPPVQSVVDTFCLSAKKKTWVPSDSPESIQEAESWNAAIDAKCAAKKVASKGN